LIFSKIAKNESTAYHRGIKEHGLVDHRGENPDWLSALTLIERKSRFYTIYNTTGEGHKMYRVIDLIGNVYFEDFEFGSALEYAWDLVKKGVVGVDIQFIAVPERDASTP
jgi:hypothetical protein